MEFVVEMEPTHYLFAHPRNDPIDCYLIKFIKYANFIGSFFSVLVAVVHVYVCACTPRFYSITVL